MSEPIKVGDLVVVVRDCCDGELLGFVGEVRLLHTDGLRCLRCGLVSGEHGAIVEFRQSFHDKLPLSWLKRIPPLEELEGEKRDEEITA